MRGQRGSMVGCPAYWINPEEWRKVRERSERFPWFPPRLGEVLTDPLPQFSQHSSPRIRALRPTLGLQRGLPEAQMQSERLRKSPVPNATRELSVQGSPCVKKKMLVPKNFS